VFIIHNRPITDSIIEKITKENIMFSTIKPGDSDFPVRVYVNSIVDALEHFDLLEGFFKNFDKREYYVKNFQEYTLDEGGQKFSQSHLYGEHLTGEQLWWTIANLNIGGDQVQKFFKYFVDDTERMTQLINTSSSPYLITGLAESFPELEKLIRKRVVKDRKLRREFDSWTTLNWLTKFPDDRELFLNENNISSHTCLKLARMFPDSRSDYLKYAIESDWGVVFDWIKLFKEDKDKLMKEITTVNDIVKWARDYPDDKSELIERLPKEGIAKWCSEVELTGKSEYLFKKYDIFDAERFNNADKATKKFMRDIYFMNTGFSTQCVNRWRYFIFHINLIDNKTFKERLDIIKRWISENSTGKYMDNVIFGLFAKEGLVIENRKQAEAVAKLFQKALNKGNARSIRSMLDRLDTSTDWRNNNIFGFDFMEDVGNNTKLKRIMMEKKLGRRG
jgi:hypothetical protein